jgi:hypothetical protein
MIGNRVVAFGFFVLCSALTGCIGAPFTAGVLDEADTQEAGDSGSLDPLNGDAGSPPVDNADVRADAGTVPATEADAGVDAEARTDGSPKVDAGAHEDDASPDASPDAGTCDGGPIYVHHVGLMGLTWQDCVPTGTYDATQALAACAAYAVVGPTPGGGSCTLAASSECGGAAGYDLGSGVTQVTWAYQGATDNEGSQTVAGHAKTGTGCPSAQDPEWN